METKKDRAAQALGRKRWIGVSPEERSRLAKAAVEARKAKRALDLAITDESQRAPINDESA